MKSFLFNFFARNKNGYEYNSLNLEDAETLEVACNNFECRMVKNEQTLLSYNVRELQSPIFVKYI